MNGELENDAAEYVLGTLPIAERTAFGARLETDAAARAAVSAWERRFSDLPVPPSIAPPQSIWTAIEQALGWNTGAAVPHLRLVAGGARGTDVVARLRRSAGRWRIAALASGAVAAALAVFVGIRELAPPADLGSYVAAVNRGGDKPALLVRVDLRTRRVMITPVAAEAPAGKSLQLWYIGAGLAPRSMGLVDRSATSMPLPDGIDAGLASFAVSVEPQGGSKSDGPSGPVAYSGALIKD